MMVVRMNHTLITDLPCETVADIFRQKSGKKLLASKMVVQSLMPIIFLIFLLILRLAKDDSDFDSVQNRELYRSLGRSFLAPSSNLEKILVEKSKIFVDDLPLEKFQFIARTLIRQNS